MRTFAIAPILLGTIVLGTDATSAAPWCTEYGGSVPGRRARNILNERSKVLNWAGTNNDDAFESASLLLADTPAHGKPDTIRRSFLKVEKDMRNPATAMRYRILETQFLRSVGADLALGASPDKKIVPLYDLTR
jgi:hypothetical protein